MGLKFGGQTDWLQIWSICLIGLNIHRLEPARCLEDLKPGHDISNMKFTIIEKVKKDDQTYRKEREKFFIEKFNTFHAGINRMP